MLSQYLGIAYGSIWPLKFLKHLMVNHTSNFEIKHKLFIELYHFQNLTYRK